MISFFHQVTADKPIWDGNKIELIHEELAEGVYAYYANDAKEKQQQGIPLATSGGFIVGNNGVFMIDAMLNKRLNKQVLDMIGRETMVPIQYAVNTSYHDDHSYGNMYLPEKTKIIQHINSKIY